MRIGLLYETREDLLASPAAREETHYHWREPEELDAVEEALLQLGHDVERLGGVEALLRQGMAGAGERPDLVMNLSVGALSRSRTAIAPAVLEHLGIPYTGGDAAAKALALNKDWLKPVMLWAGIATPSWLLITPAEPVQALPDWPVSILKPASEGYSLGLRRFERSWGLKALRELVESLHQDFGGSVLCEELIAGREVTVGVVGNGGEGIALLGAVETLDADGAALGERLLDLTAKRRGGLAKVAVDLNEPVLQPLRRAVLRLVELLGPLDYASFDFRIDAAGTAHLLDLNADATLHPQRSLTRVAAQAGMTYQDLIGAIVAACRRRHGGS
ncbi:MAG: hypothetical protein KME02_12695 [Aphanothece saxicola GSE-SYN-MK-01-06B]|jgi:D-alanine-D-alanine ligase|nr:hypothetical protein [Aphanothece saxicola GSE-SYN-MK-01-06B]